MTKKEILWKVCLVFFCLYLFYMTAKFLLGKADTFTIVGISILSLDLIVLIIGKIMDKVNEYQTYKSLVEGLEYLQAVHKVRYKLYFIGDKEKIEEYSTEIERYGNAMLNVGKTAISSKLISKKHVKSVEEIINQTEKLMTTTN